MNSPVSSFGKLGTFHSADAPAAKPPVPSGLVALCSIAAFFRIASDPASLARELALGEGEVRHEDILRSARILRLKARYVEGLSATRLLNRARH